MRKNIRIPLKAKTFIFSVTSSHKSYLIPKILFHVDSKYLLQVSIARKFPLPE